jgi:pimeloyl-ACP methyl ester carboxylesterase
MMTSHPDEHSPEPARTGTVKAPGARLFYRALGSGPCLMMLSGGAAGADGFGSVAPYLAADYTAVTYDRRGLSRSPLDDPGKDPAITITTHSEDVHRILTRLGAAPAMVFGSSIGALIGLDLLIRHPEDVRMLVAHEPPVGSLLAGDEKPAVSFTDSYEQTGDADAALRQFAASLTPKDLLLLAPVRQDGDRTRARNSEFFITNDAPAVQRYELDLDALKGLTSQVVIGGGRDGREFSPYASASRLAERLGISLHEFPGNHAGYAIYPAEFARSLRQALRTGGSQVPPALSRHARTARLPASVPGARPRCSAADD